MSGLSCNSKFVAELSAANPRTGACSGEGSGSGERVYTPVTTHRPSTHTPLSPEIKGMDIESRTC